MHVLLQVSITYVCELMFVQVNICSHESHEDNEDNSPSVAIHLVVRVFFSVVIVDVLFCFCVRSFFVFV